MSDFIRKNKSLTLSCAGAAGLIIAVILLEHTAPAGFFSVLGLSLLLCGGRCAENKRDALLNAGLFWLSHSIRFCGLFGTKFIYAMFCSLLIVPYTALITAAIAAERRVNRRSPLLGVLILPAAYGLIAYLLAAVNLGYISNMMSYLMRIVNIPLLGEYGMTVLLMLILMCWGSLLTAEGRHNRLILACVGVLLAAATAVSSYALRSSHGEPDYYINVALATSQEMDFTGESGKFYTVPEQLAMFDTALSEAQGADLLLLNEEYFSCSEADSDALIAEIAQRVAQYGIPTLAGFEIDCGDEPGINEAIYFDTSGEVLYTYIKNNLVPFIEAGYYVDGPEEPAVLTAELGGHSVELGFVICYDLNDDAYMSKLPDSVELLLVPAWDWDTENLEQKRTLVRAERLGLTMVKHSFDGFSLVGGTDGVCYAELDLRGRYEAVEVVSVPIWDK